MDRKKSKRIIDEIVSRLTFLRDVGLSYLTLNRKSNTLSGGETQRINIATSIGSALVGSIYVLITGLKINVSQKGKYGTVALFVLICLFVLNISISVPFLEQLAIVVIIFYFYVAIEYLYNLIYKSG